MTICVNKGIRGVGKLLHRGDFTGVKVWGTRDLNVATGGTVLIGETNKIDLITPVKTIRAKSVSDLLLIFRFKLFIVQELFDIELYILNFPTIISTRGRSPLSVVKSIVSNLTVTEIIFLIVSILTVTKIVLNVLIFPLLPLLIFHALEVKGVHHLNHLAPMTRVTSILILMSEWIGWSKTGSNWAQRMDHHLGGGLQK